MVWPETVGRRAGAAQTVSRPLTLIFEGAGIHVHVGELHVTGWVGIVWSTEDQLMNSVHPSDRLESLLLFSRIIPQISIVLTTCNAAD